MYLNGGQRAKSQYETKHLERWQVGTNYSYHESKYLVVHLW